MIRQYRAFEDLEEPCFLVPEPEWITVTYQMKSIICQWRWDEIKELVPKKLSKKSKSNRDTESVKDLKHSQIQIRPHSNSAPASPNLRAANAHHHPQKDPEKILKKNLLKIEFMKTDDVQSNIPMKAKWYRFDTRDILDEFLSDANRHGYIERLVIHRWFSTKIKYVPNKCQNEQQESSRKAIQMTNNNKKRTCSTSSSCSSQTTDSLNPNAINQFNHNHKKKHNNPNHKIILTSSSITTRTATRI